MTPRSLRIAVRFLTRLPMPGDHAVRPGELGASLAWHPVVGALIGGLLALAGLALDGVPPLVRAVLVTLLAPLLTGAMHEDALADAADGLGGRTPERTLEIMRDSRIGAYGALAASGALLLRFTALASIEPAAWPLALVAASSLSRAPGALLLAALPAARPDGLGGAAVEGLRWFHAAFALCCAVAIAAFTAGQVGIVAAALALAITAAHGGYWRRRLGGVTGDLAGAANLLAELAALVVFAAAWPATGAAGIS